MQLDDDWSEPVEDEEIAARFVAFRLDGDRNLIHQRPVAHEHVERLRTCGEIADTQRFRQRGLLPSNWQ
jgi:hypothetical protein